MFPLTCQLFWRFALVGAATFPREGLANSVDALQSGHTPRLEPKMEDIQKRPDVSLRCIKVEKDEKHLEDNYRRRCKKVLTIYLWLSSGDME